MTSPTTGSAMPTGSTAAPALPSFNNTLGALFIGSAVSTALYGVVCMQTFVYFTSRRAKVDNWFLRGLVSLVFVLDTVHTVFYLAALYKYLITDFVNPLALLAGGPTSGSKLILLDEVLFAIAVILLIQMFFCRRLWVISATAFNVPVRVALVALAGALSLLSCGAWSAVSIVGYNQHSTIMTDPSANFELSLKISTASGIVFDAIVTTALATSLYRAKSGIRKSNHVINMIIAWTVNTNLITTLLSLAQLITFLAFPHTTIYGGIVLVLPKSYINSFLATLNSREFFQRKLKEDTNSGAGSAQKAREHMIQFDKNADSMNTGTYVTVTTESSTLTV